MATLLPLLPVWVVLCVAIPLAIRLESRGPALYRQTRLGRGGRAFTVIKFRTMIDGAEVHTGPVWAAWRDARTTRVGRVLRPLHLDELPQLVNVPARRDEPGGTAARASGTGRAFRTRGSGIRGAPPGAPRHHGPCTGAQGLPPASAAQAPLRHALYFPNESLAGHQALRFVRPQGPAQGRASTAARGPRRGRKTSRPQGTGEHVL